MKHIMGTECVLDNISQKRMRKESLTSCVNGNVIGLVLFFFQISDQIFRDKYEYVTKFKKIKRIQHLYNIIIFLSNYKNLIFYHDEVYDHTSVIKKLFIPQFLPTGIIIEKCLWKAVRTIIAYKALILLCKFKHWYTWKS